MNPTTTKIAVCCTLAVGAGLWGSMAQKFDAEDSLSYEPNVACVKGSPYGKVLALAVQGPIDFYWHSGMTHTDAETLNALDSGRAEGCSAGCTDGCDDHGHSHDHAGHDHDHGHDHSDHGEDCGCPAHTEKAKVVVSRGDQKPFHQRAKQQVREMAAFAHRKTDNRPLTPAHRKYLQSVTEDKLRLAYELDPSNYTNYGNYHLFISTTTYGKADADDDQALILARRTLEFCKKDSMDPTSWLTASSAAYNIVYHIGRYHKKYTIPEAKASLAEFDFCIRNFEKLSKNALEEGRVVSEARLKEMQTRARYLGKLREAQGVYMKNVMTREMAKRAETIHQGVH